MFLECCKAEKRSQAGDPWHHVPGLLALTFLNTHFPASPSPFGPGDGSAPELSSLECTRSRARLGDIISSTENDKRSSKGTEPQLFLLFSLRVLSLREEHSWAVFTALLHSDMSPGTCLARKEHIPQPFFCCSSAWTEFTIRHCICSPRLSRAQPQPLPILTGSFSDCQTSFPSLGLPVPVTTCLSIRKCQKWQSHLRSVCIRRGWHAHSSPRRHWPGKQ